jgi:dienelactone hydrolase
VVAPEALSRFYVDRGEPAAGTPARVGATWMTREDREAEIADYVRYLDRALDAAAGRPGAAAPALGVLGFSQGAATACRWAAHRHRLGRPAAGSSSGAAPSRTTSTSPRAAATRCARCA